MPATTLAIDAAAIDAIAARFAARGGQPGLAYGVVAGGELIHSGGWGERWAGGPVPDADTVFRIASMTKSFTATMVLLLRDRGALRLTDAAESYVPELSGVRPVSPDCPLITIRHLLTMTAGFPTDDPWGDRQQALDPALFARLLASGGVRPAWAPGTVFEYSNLGYAILGRVIEAVTGEDYAEAVRTHVLAPLQMSQTGFEASEFDPAVLARGYRQDSGTWLELEPDGYGAFAPMGGIFSSVADLARWVAGFAAAVPSRPPAGDATVDPIDAVDAIDRAHPLSRATRREMQFGQAPITSGGDGVVLKSSGPLSISYGYGLFAEDDAAFGAIVQHSGGYPGYGSQMRWHPATGIGTIVLANGTYAGAGTLASELLAAVLGARDEVAGERGGIRSHGPVPAPGGPWPETLTARSRVDALLQNWDDAAAKAIFSANIDMDRPLAQRQADVARLRERIGRFGADLARPPECDSPAHCRWWLTGEHGTVAVQIKLAPLQQPLVQQLILPVPPAPGSALHEVLDMLVSSLASNAVDWPAGLEAADGLDTGEVLRRLRLAAAWAGPCQLDSYLAGNGSTSTTVLLTGLSGNAELTADVGESGRALARLTVSLRTSQA
ncbi:MAG TPA: serine hydrolase domain-containing protein [Streptosporangiaceae bacterium]|nr:serine hydrolase domain-containing protein [Streptosporangiaceae bacterium]